MALVKNQILTFMKGLTMKTQTSINPDEVRKCAAGYIGGKEVAAKATDGEVVQLVNYQDEIARLHNRIVDLKRYYNNAVKAIKARPNYLS